MKTEKLIVTLSIELPDKAILPRGIIQRCEMNIEGAVEGTLMAHGVRPQTVKAVIHKEGEA